MASPLQIQNGLKPQAAPAQENANDLAFYIVPPMMVLAVYAFCALVPNGAPPAPPVAAAKPAVQAPAKVEDAVATTTPEEVEPKPAPTATADPNASLPAFAIPSGKENVLEGAEGLSFSAEDKDCPAANAVDGSCEDDSYVAHIKPVGKEPAWWQLSAEKGQYFTGDTIVIYGGGSQSPAGKLTGGFHVDLEVLDEGNVVARSRSFCEPGFALEGYEAWKLGGEQKIISVRVVSSRPDTPLVLREVQLIGTPVEQEEDDSEEPASDDPEDMFE